MVAERTRDDEVVPRPRRSRLRLPARVAVAVLVLCALLLSHRIGRAEPTGDYRPELPPDALTNGCYPLPEGVRLDLPYQVRSDGDVRVAGDSRRRVLAHYSLVDEDEALARLVASFEEAGFRRTGLAPAHDAELVGGDPVVLRKQGVGRIAIAVQALPDTSPDTLVRGELELDLPVVERASDLGWCEKPSSTKRWPDGLSPEDSR